MTKIIKNQYLGECEVDSLKIRIPLKALINYDKSLNDTYIKVCDETGEPILDEKGDIKKFKDSCKVYYLDGYWNEKAISLEIENCEKTVNLLRLNLKSK